MSDPDAFLTSAASYDPNSVYDGANMHESSSAFTMPMDISSTDTVAPQQSTQERPPAQIKRKAEGEPEVEHQQQQPTKKFKFSLGMSGAAPPPAAPAAAPVAPSYSSQPHAPAVMPATATISNAVAANDTVAAREALLRELQSLDAELLELDKQMTAPTAPAAPVYQPPARQPRAPRRTHVEGGEFEDEVKVQPLPKTQPRPPIRTQAPAVSRPPSLHPAPTAAHPKRKPHEPALPAPQWTRGPRKTRGAAGEAKAWDEVRALIRDLLAHHWAWPFKEPVDPIKLGIPDYPSVIKHPMDLGTIKTRLAKKFYNSIQDFVADLSLVWNNCMTYNAPITDVYKMAESLSKISEQRLSKIFDMVKPNPREELHRIRDAFARAEAQLHALEQEEAQLRSDLDAAQQVANASYVLPPPLDDATPLTYEEKLSLYHNINNLNEQQSAGLIELISQSNPELIVPGLLTLDLNTDELDNALLRRMEIFLAQNSFTSTQPYVKPEVSAPVPSATSFAEPSSVKNESIDIEENRQSSSSSDDEVSFVPPTSTFPAPAPTPSSDVPQISHLPESIGGKMPRIIDPTTKTDDGGDVDVGADWMKLVEEDKPASEEPAGASDAANGLWDQFKNRTAHQQQLEREKEEREEALRLQKLREIEEQRKHALEEEERKREEEALQERQREEEIARKREEARLARERVTPQVDLLAQSNLMKQFEGSLNPH